jgi:hypothetical protein
MYFSLLSTVYASLTCNPRKKLVGLSAPAKVLRTRGKPTKTRRFDITAAQEVDLAALAALPDDQIDTTDIPEQMDRSGTKRGLFFLRRSQVPE